MTSPFRQQRARLSVIQGVVGACLKADIVLGTVSSPVRQSETFPLLVTGFGSIFRIAQRPKRGGQPLGSGRAIVDDEDANEVTVLTCVWKRLNKSGGHGDCCFPQLDTAGVKQRG